MWREPRLGLAGLVDPARAGEPVGSRGGRPVSRGELHAETAGWFACFQRLGASHVALHFDDALHAAAALYGAWHAGKTVWWPGDALPATAERLAAHVGAFAGDWPGLPSAIPQVREAPEPVDPAWAPLDAQAAQLVVFTSGSSGEPSAIPKRLHQLFDEVRALEAQFGARLQGASVHATVSHQHIYGLLFRILWPLAAGRPTAARRVAYLEDLRAAPGRIALVASPAHLKRLQLADTGDLAERLAAVFSSGGPLPAEALGPCAERLGQTPIEVYGSSETGGVAWRQRASGAGEGEPWRALPGVEWQVHEGRLQLRSPHVGGDGWFNALDHARAEGPGFVLLGRADRIVKVEEKRVSLSAVEQALLETGQVLDARALLLPGSRQELGVVLVPTADAWAAIEQTGRAAWLAPLRERLADRLESTVRPRRWRLVSELPANTQGKTTQLALQALFDPLRPPARVLAREPLSARLRLDVQARHPAFEGHFAGHPVLPGVIQLDWAERFARELFALQPAFLGLDQLKFQQIIAPGCAVELSLTVNADGSELRFALTSDRGPHASGKLRFGAA